MQFVANGPDIPASLLRAHEKGRVVFFCGAGTSYPAGLPGFAGLVEKLYSSVGERRDDIEDELFNAKQFDRAVGHFEGRIQGGRRSVRRHLGVALAPDLARPRALTSHLALLALARRRDGTLRIVTTNFDTLFEVAADRYGVPSFPVYPDPPGRNRWEGLVYLHGRMPALPSDEDVDRLTLSDVDFGKAYLMEAWAARFVAALFREYTVCFVGYSVDDPVLRYMTAAHAANDDALEIYAFASFGGDADRERQSRAWTAKNVTPILYDQAADHRHLHRSLRMWASIHRDGVQGVERIVTRLSRLNPISSNQDNDFAGRLQWALAHESGLPAKRFADLNPVPSLDWLQALSADRYVHGDLDRFDVSPGAEVDHKLRFSLLRRPAPYRYASWMTLVSGGAEDSRWDDVMFHLARWLMRHLDDPALVIWLAKQGGQLHSRWPWMIELELDRLATLAQQGKTDELDAIRMHAPNAIPGPLMRTLWRLLLTGRVKSPWREHDLYRWNDRLKRDGLTATMRLELRDLLAPKVTLRKPFRWDVDAVDAGEPSRIRQLVDWDLVLATDHVRSAIGDLADEHWHAALPLVLDDLQQLLRDALDLSRELGEADEFSDRSQWALPSISAHRQNRGFRDWAVLIELLRDAWLATREHDAVRACRIASGWFDVPYPTFKRLALFAAAHQDAIDPTQWLAWLVVDDAWWLWSTNTKRETMRLLVQQGATLSESLREKLEAAILSGPPRRMFVDDIEPEEWQSLVDRSVWVHLSKLREGAGQLGEAAAHRVESLSAANPTWTLSDNERDEFSSWMSGTGDPDYDASRDVEHAPRKRVDLVKWLRLPPPENRPMYEDTWRETCRSRFFHAYTALCDLAREGTWPAGRWREAFQAWSDDDKALRSWRYAAPLVQNMPDEVMQEDLHSFTRWLDGASKSIDRHEQIFLHLCGRVLQLPLDAGTGIRENNEPIDKPVTEAINHPIGHITQALLNLWFKREPDDGDSLPKEIEPFFTQMCDTGVDRFRHSRVLLASRLIALFRVDRPWTERYLLPLFDWDLSPIEARRVWEGFLWSPRLYRPLLIAFKAQFLATARHYQDLGEHSRQFSAFLTYAALEPVEGYTSDDFRAAVGALPRDGLEEVASALSQALEGAGEQRADYWKNRVQPFWHRIWPKSRDLASNSIADSLARMCIAAGDSFPSALEAVEDWLRPIEHPDYVVHLLQQSGNCARFPVAALRLLHAVLVDQQWAPRDLRQCLDAIGQTMPDLSQDPRHQRLLEYARRRGI